MTLRPATDATSRAQYLDVALEMLHDNGPRDRGIRLLATGVAASAGLARSGVYQLWPTMEELDRDLVRYCAFELSSWTRLILRQPPDLAMAEIVERTLNTVGIDFGGLARSSICGWEDSPIFEEAGAVELAWLDEFAMWVSAHLAAHKREPATGTSAADIALMLAVSIEGMSAFRHITEVFTTRSWPRDSGREIAQLIDGSLAEMTVPSNAPPSASGWVCPEPAPSRFSPRQRRILDAVIVALDQGAPGLTRPIRLVEHRQLAVALGLTERAVHQIWPTISDLNRDLAVEAIRRLRGTSGDALGLVLNLGFEEAYEFYQEHFSSAAQAMVELGVHRDQPFRSWAFGDPEVRRVFAAGIREWATSLQVPYVALLTTGGFHLKRGVTPRVYVDGLFSTVIGCQRFGIQNPDLLRRTTSYGVPLFGLATSKVARSLTARSTDAPQFEDGKGRTAPRFETKGPDLV